jgi:hypothetical protein
MQKVLVIAKLSLAEWVASSVTAGTVSALLQAVTC